MSDERAPLGAVLELDVGPPAHGGSCVARHHGQVVFVRHAIPGERVRAVVTDNQHEAYLRADAVDILEASPDRVAAPCPYAGPGRCGGCDWQHVTGTRQRELKAAVIVEQFRRLAGIELGAEFSGVEAIGPELLGWRTRITYATGPDDRLGLHRHRSREVERIDACLLGVEGVGDASALAAPWPGVTGVEVARGDDGSLTVLTHRPGAGRQARGRRPPDRVDVVDGPQQLVRTVAGRPMSVSAAGFWQVHPAAADAFAAAVLEFVRPAPGETVLDLYCGAGALTGVLASAVGERGRVIGIESNAHAVADAQHNLASQPWASVLKARVVAEVLAALDVVPDLVVLDPPRAGAGRDVMAAILGTRPRAVAYVACDPAALARDVRVALDAGWRLVALRGFDAFPMTHHVECVAHLAPL